MATLYVENVPDELYQALRARAQVNKKSISAEVLTLLAENVPTSAELARRKAFMHRLAQIRSRKTPSPRSFLTTEAMQREDRQR